MQTAMEQLQLAAAMRCREEAPTKAHFSLFASNTKADEILR